MAGKQRLDNLKAVAERFAAVDRDGLLRTTLGKASLDKDFGERLDHLQRKLQFALDYGIGVCDQYVDQVVNAFEMIRQQMDAQAKRSDPEYVAQRSPFLGIMDSYTEQLLHPWPAFVSAAVEMRGFLQDEGIRKEYQKTVDSMRKEADGALKQVREEASKTIGEARELATQIEQRARRTAAHISVEAAQEQFRLAGDHHKSQVTIWATLSVLAVVAFFLVALVLERVQFPEAWKWHTLYYTAIRVVILGAIAALAALCFRVLRAHMHMREHNFHRQRLANSMAAFVESAVTPEQRDLILGRLVDSIAAFGTSGLLTKEDESIYSPKMVIDAVTRSIAHPTGGA